MHLTRWGRFVCYSIALFSKLSGAQTVPSAYQDIYNNLTNQIQSFDSAVQTGWNHSAYSTLFAPQLQSATSDQFTQLLGANYMTSAVLPQLAQLQALGATGVTVHIDFPILYQPFYASNPAQFQQFVAFYQQLAQTVHSRGLALVVESAAGEPLPGDNAAAYQPFYTGLSWNDYMNGRAQNALNVAQLIQPDFMSVMSEPDTEASTTGQASVGTPSGSLQLLQTVLATLQAGNVTKVKVGAGAGTWIKNYSQYVQNFIATPIDFVDMHIYPVNGNDFMTALSAADTIHAAGKEVGMSEAWAWKVRDSELGNLSYVNISARDPFSFWAPVDIAFLKAIVDFSQYKQVAFISPFWTDFFYAYLDYNVNGNDAPSAVLPEAMSQAGRAVGVGSFSPTGLAWENMLLTVPDSIPPAIPAAPAATVIGTTGVNLAWTPGVDNVGVAAYQLYRNGALLATTSGLVWYDNALTSGATYTYSLAAFDASGNVSGQSAPLSVTTINNTPPPAPAGLLLAGGTSRTVCLSWLPSTDISGIGGYRILRGTSAANLAIVGNTVGVNTTYTDNVGPSSTFYYQVEAYIPNGVTSGPSNEVTATTPADPLPPAPASPLVTGVTSSSVSLLWTPSTDSRGIAGYRILRGTSPSTLSIIKNVSAPAITYTDAVGPSTTYYYQVESYITSGLTSLPGSQISATTMPRKP